MRTAPPAACAPGRSASVAVKRVSSGSWNSSRTYLQIEEVIFRGHFVLEGGYRIHRCEESETVGRLSWLLSRYAGSVVRE